MTRLLSKFIICTGSSIELANIDARNIYDEVMLELQKLKTLGMSQFDRYLTKTNGASTSESKTSAVSTALLVNNRSWKRRELVSIRNGDSCILSESQKKNGQSTFDGQTLVMVQCESYAVSSLEALPVQSTESVSIRSISNDANDVLSGTEKKKQKVFIMENALIVVRVACNGVIESMIHKPTGKEVIKVDADSDGIGGNNLLLFEDKPLFWEAWDVEIYHLQKYHSVSQKNANGKSNGKYVKVHFWKILKFYFLDKMQENVIILPAFCKHFVTILQAFLVEI